MKTLKLIGLLFLAACGRHSSDPQTTFKQILPDTSKSSSGRMTRETFHQTRKIEQKLDLISLLNGSNNEEIRIWRLSGSYDPQSVTILAKLKTDAWHLRQLTFNHSKNDSITSDVTRQLPSKVINTLNLISYWNLPSQSDLKTGDAYGCMDGSDVFIEMANTAKYRFMWYRCPDINETKDSAFHRVFELRSKIAQLGGEL